LIVDKLQVRRDAQAVIDRGDQVERPHRV
jgi:hypothetical protein